MATRPFIVQDPTLPTPVPFDGTVTNTGRPQIALTFSENVVETEARDPGNYLLFDDANRSYPINSVVYDASRFQVFLNYNNGNELPAGRFTLFVRGEKIHDVDEGLPLADPGQLLTVNGASSASFNYEPSISTVGYAGTGSLNAITNVEVPPGSPIITGTSAPTTLKDALLIDLNKDNAPELVVINQVPNQPGRLDIFRGIPGVEPSFGRTPTQLILDNPSNTSFTNPSALTAGDFNSDGSVDLAIASDTLGTGQIRVFLNDGRGGLSRGTLLNVTSTPVDVLAADLDGDSKTDLVVATANNQLALFQGDGAGFFRPPITVALNAAVGRPAALAFGNIVGGAQGDLAVATAAGIEIFQNNSVVGSPSFTRNTTLDATRTYNSVAIGNIDGIGPLDLVASTGSLGSFVLPGEVSIFLNQPGGFAAPSRLSTDPFNGAVGSPGSYSVNIADIDGDGRNDLLVANDYGFVTNTNDNKDSVVVLRGQGNGAFSSPTAYRTDVNPQGLTTWTNPLTGVMEIAATFNGSASTATTLRPDGVGGLLTSQDTVVPGLNITPASGVFGANSPPYGKIVATGDINGDLLQDLVVVNPNNDTISIMVAQPGGSYAQPNVLPLNSGSRPIAVALADFGRRRTNGTPILDILVANQQPAQTAGGSVLRLANDGSGSFIALLPITVGLRPTDMVLGDFDKDGNIDVAVAHSGGSRNPATLADQGITILRGAGNGNFLPAEEVASGLSAHQIVVGDFNVDGTLDIAVTQFTQAGTVVVLLGDPNSNRGGTPALSFPTRISNPAGEFPTGIAVGDLNRDGRPDIVVANESIPTTNNVFTSYVSVLINDIAGRFLPALRTDVLPGSSTRLQSLVVTDLNNDLYQDVVASTEGQTLFNLPGGGNQNTSANNVIALISTGDGTFEQPRLFATAGGNRLRNFTVLESQVSPTFVNSLSNPFLRVTSFTVRGTSTVVSDLINNGSFDTLDLAGEKGNIIAWQQQEQRDSHGGWTLQTGSQAPLSGDPVQNPPDGRYAVMLDQPQIVLPYNSALGAFTQRPESAEDSMGTHFLYQDIFIPEVVESVNLSLLLYIDNTMAGAFFDAGVLDYFPDRPTALRPRNQQVRIDIMDPNAPIDDVGSGVLLSVWSTTRNLANSQDDIFGYDGDPNTPQREAITASLTQFRGRAIRLRIAAVNNQGEMLVGVDKVQVLARFTDTTSPAATSLRLRNPGSPDPTNPTLAGRTTDPTIVGRINDDGTADNIDYLGVYLNRSPFVNGVRVEPDFRLTNFDELGNFIFTLPTDLPGVYNVSMVPVDKAGNGEVVSNISFVFQGPSATTWQAVGPGPIRFVAGGINYTSLSGKITAVATDPRDKDGNTMYVGSDNGGLWKTTDGGRNWTPLTDFLPGDIRSSVSVNIGAVAVDPNEPDNVYAATGVADTYETSKPGFGILKSTDAGRTFSLIGQTEFAGAQVTRIEISKRRASDGRVFIYVAVASGGAFGSGVYFSDNGGASWTNLLTPSRMFLENGQTVAQLNGVLGSVTDIRIDRLSFEEENLWIGIGNIDLIRNANGQIVNGNMGGVWKSPNHGATWFRQGGANAGMPDVATYGTNIRRITLAVASDRPEESGTVYVLMNNPRIQGNNDTEPHDVFNVAGTSSQGRFAAGLYKTEDGGLNWTKVMLRQNVQRPQQPIHDFVDIGLFGGTQQEQDAVGALAIDPNDVEVVYVGGSTRFGSNAGPAHGLIRVDTRNMLLGQDFVFNSFINRDPILGMGDDRYKKYDAFQLNLPAGQPGRYTNGDGYEGEGVFWYDLQMGTISATRYDNLQLPATIHAFAFDSLGRLVVGTEGGLWRGVSQGFTYDTTSGAQPIVGAFAASGTLYSIEWDIGNFGSGQTPTPVFGPGLGTPLQGGMIFTSLNGNLQISDQTSVAIDPVDRQTIHASQANLGWAKTTGALPESLTWTSTLDNLNSLPSSAFIFGLPGTTLVTDPFVREAPFSGEVRAAPRNENEVSPSDAAPLSRIYRVFVDRAGFSFNGRRIQASNINGDQGTFQVVIRGLDQRANEDIFPPLAVNPTQIVDEKGFFLDQLLYGTNVVQRSDDSGGVWDTISPPLGAGAISSLAIAPNGRHSFWVGTSTGQVFIDLRNGSTPFPNSGNGLPTGLQQPRVLNLVVDPTLDANGDNTTGYATFGGFNVAGNPHVFMTTNAGGNWVNITGNLPNRPVYAIAVDRRPKFNAPNGRLYVGTEVGVFMSEDWVTGLANATWTRLGDGVPNVPVRDIQFDEKFEKLVIATEGRGTFTISTDVIGPRVESFDPANPTNGPINFFRVIFDEPVDPRTFTVDQVALFAGPNGPIQVLSITPEADPRTREIDYTRFVIRFADQITDGQYQIQLGTGIKDFVGNAIDNNRNLINGEDLVDRFTTRFIVNTTDNANFIAGLYHDLLSPERDPDNEGFQTLVGPAEEARIASLARVAGKITSSDEVRTNLIAGFYSSTDNLGKRTPFTGLGNFLGRSAGVAERNYWVALLKQGMTQEQIINMMTGTPEYFAKNGLTDDGFVAQMYRDILGREQDDRGRKEFIRQLEEAEARARFEVGFTVATSVEQRNNIIISNYFGLLGRGPGTPELIFWSNYLQQGNTTEQLQASLIGSDEYFRNHGSTNSTWLTGAYQDILFRGPDDGGFQFFLSQLNAGAPRSNVAFQMYSTDEYRTRLVVSYFGRYLKRAVSTEDVSFFVAQMRAGATSENIQAQVLASKEYFQRQFTTTAGTATQLPAQDKNWTTAVFLDIMGRAPTTAESDAFVNGTLAAREQQARSTAAGVFTDSYEYRARLVNLAYTSYLGRSPSTGEINLWQPALRQPSSGAGSALPVEQFLTAVLSSGEYLSKQRGVDGNGPDIDRTDDALQDPRLTTNLKWVQSLYLNLLDRTPPSTEREAVLEDVLSGYRNTREQLAGILLHSDEYRQGQVQDYFTTYLRRPVKQAEQDFYVLAFSKGATVEQIVSTILASGEYYQNPQLGAGDRTRWLNQVYRDLLGRDRDAGSQIYLDLLNNTPDAALGAVRQQIALEILRSTEYLNRFITQLYRDVFGLDRVVSTSEANYWISLLQSGTRTDEEVTAGILSSSEYFRENKNYP